MYDKIVLSILSETTNNRREWRRADMKYKDIFSPEFLRSLNERVSTDPQNKKINPEDEPEGSFIDIKSILAILGVPVEYKDLSNISGQLIESKIFINKNESQERQRFTMAHELGHIFQGKYNAYRKEEEYSNDQEKDEIFANRFAAQFLMPRKLVIEYTERYIENEGFDPDQLNQETVDDIVAHLASELKVSTQAMGFRVKNLNLFTE